MEYEITKIAEVEGIGIIYSVEAELALDEFLEIVSPDMVPSIREIALARIWESELGRWQVHVREGVMHAPGMLPILMLDPPFLDNPKPVTSAEREFVELHMDPEPIIAQARQDQELNLLERRTFWFPQAKGFTIVRENILGILPRVLRERFSREGANQDTIEDIILESGRYLRDEGLMKKQDPVTQFAVSLFKDAAIPYALFSPYDICVKIGRLESDGKVDFAYLKSVAFDEVRHSSCIDGWRENMCALRRRFYVVK